MTAGTDRDPSGKTSVMVCFGTRPEVIKLAPVIHALEADGGFSVDVVTTAQHREMLDQMLETFGLTPGLDLDLMRPRQSLSDITAEAVRTLGPAIAERRPDAVLVQGDTTTVFCAALAAFCEGVPVGHVEAGLRTNDPRRPFPEEMNRRLASTLATWHYCPTERNASTLREEGVRPSAIVVTGNTVIDALLATDGRPLEDWQLQQLPPKSSRRRVLVTLHRRETQGEPHRLLCRMLKRLAERPDVEVLFPVHLNPTVRQSVEEELRASDNVHLMEPLEYRIFAHAMRTSDLIVTDSGGLQEEAPSFDVPVVVMRDTTERQEGVDAGCVLLAGTVPSGVEAEIVRLLEDREHYQRMARAVNPYGDGRAAERIVRHLHRELVLHRTPSLLGDVDRTLSPETAR